MCKNKGNKMMDKKITPVIFAAMEAYKKDNGLSSDYKFCNKLGIPMQTFSSWKHGRSTSINQKLWEKIEPYLRAYLTLEKSDIDILERDLERMRKLLSVAYESKNYSDLIKTIFNNVESLIEFNRKMENVYSSR